MLADKRRWLFAMETAGDRFVVHAIAQIAVGPSENSSGTKSANGT